MKKLLLLLIAPLLLTGCAVQLESVVDNSLIKQPYKNPLVVIPYEDYSIKEFSNNLKDDLETTFKGNQRKIEVLAIELIGTSLTLNANKRIDQEVQKSMSNDPKDLLLVFQPTNIEFSEGGYRVFTYQITGIDTSTKKEVWKANFTATRGHLGAGKMAEQSARKIYERLVTDKVI